jgi:hypothetical protein
MREPMPITLLPDPDLGGTPDTAEQMAKEVARRMLTTRKSSKHKPSAKNSSQKDAVKTSQIKKDLRLAPSQVGVFRRLSFL